MFFWKRGNLKKETQPLPHWDHYIKVYRKGCSVAWNKSLREMLCTLRNKYRQSSRKVFQMHKKLAIFRSKKRDVKKSNLGTIFHSFGNFNLAYATHRSFWNLVMYFTSPEKQPGPRLSSYRFATPCKKISRLLSGSVFTPTQCCHNKNLIPYSLLFSALIILGLIFGHPSPIQPF